MRGPSKLPERLKSCSNRLPSSSRRRAIRIWSRDPRKVAKPHYFVQTGWSVQEFLDHTTPSAP